MGFGNRKNVRANKMSSADHKPTIAPKVIQKASQCRSIRARCRANQTTRATTGARNSTKLMV